jgi:hypothetical protein
MQTSPAISTGWQPRSPRRGAQGSAGPDAVGRIDYLELSFAELLAETDAWCAKAEGEGVAGATGRS